MESGALKLLDANLYRRGQAMTALARALAVYLRRALGHRERWLRLAHDLADAIAAGVGAAVTGGMDSPIWLFFFPHVVSVSVRGGLGYALIVAVLDAGMVFALTFLTPQPPLGILPALALLFCGFVGGTTSSYLAEIQDRLHSANAELSSKNTRLQELLSAQQAARREQEQALALLGASERRYKGLLERIQDGVVIVRDGRIAYANRVFGAMAGRSPEALLGLDFRDLVPEADRAELSERYTRWQATEAVSGVLETRLLAGGDAPLLVSVRAGSVDHEGRRSIIATLRDITRERRMEQDVKGQAERLAAINEIANAVNLSLTVEDIASAVAHEARRLLPFDVVSLGVLDADGAQLEIVSPEGGVLRRRAAFPRGVVSWAFRRPLSWCEGDPEPEPEHLPRLFPGGGLKSVATVPLLSKGRVIGSLNVGRQRPAAFTALELAVLEPVARHIAAALDNARLLEAVRLRGREFESLLEISRRISERLDLRELLPLVTRSVNRVMATEHCMLLLRDGDRLRVAAREGVEPELVDAFKDQRVGDSLSGWVIQQGRVLAVEDMQADPRSMFAELVHTYAYQSYLGVPLRRGSEIIGALEVLTKNAARRFGPDEQALMSAFADQVAVAIDNARLLDQARQHLERVVEANRQLEELDRLRREYLRNVSHEFRTPLTVIRGYAEFLENATAEPRTVADVMQVIVESCDRVIDLVDTLIEVSRVEQRDAARTLQLQELDLKEVAEASLEPLRPAADRKSICLDLHFPERDALLVKGDRGLLGHLVRKLVDNAVKYSPAGARVLVRGGGEGDDLTLEVEDFGIGIPPEHVPRIFEKFYMVDGGITRRAGGSGVGLYLVRETVRLHHGRVDVESRPGQGSVFRVRLPRHAWPEGASA
jgi:PAS domain S-box-containing protein